MLDANLLVLLAVGIASQHHIATHKRLGGYSKADFDLLRSLLARASRIVVTPNTPTEAVNLSAHIAEPIRTSIKQAFRQLLTKTEEIYVESARASRHVAFFRLDLITERADWPSHASVAGAMRPPLRDRSVENEAS